MVYGDVARHMVRAEMMAERDVWNGIDSKTLRRFLTLRASLRSVRRAVLGVEPSFGFEPSLVGARCDAQGHTLAVWQRGLGCQSRGVRDGIDSKTLRRFLTLRASLRSVHRAALVVNSKTLRRSHTLRASLHSVRLAFGQSSNPLSGLNPLSCEIVALVGVSGARKILQVWDVAEREGFEPSMEL